jgi:hypothetical protein
VEVIYDEKRLPLADLVAAASKSGAADVVFLRDEAARTSLEKASATKIRRTSESPRPAKSDDRKYYLGKTSYRHLPLTPAQAMRVNAELAARRDPARWLTARQLELKKRIDRALEKDRKALDGLEPPESEDGIWAYVELLLKRLP